MVTKVLTPVQHIARNLLTLSTAYDKKLGNHMVKVNILRPRNKTKHLQLAPYIQCLKVKSEWEANYLSGCMLENGLNLATSISLHLYLQEGHNLAV